MCKAIHLFKTPYGNCSFIEKHSRRKPDKNVTTAA
jgi:hypothetical protein